MKRLSVFLILIATALPLVAADRLDFSLDEAHFPFVDAWLDEFCDEMGEAMVGGGSPDYHYLKPDDPKAKSPHDRAWAFYRYAAKFYAANRAFLAAGSKCADAGKLTHGHFHVNRMNGLEPKPAHPCIHAGVWQAADGRKRLFLVNVSWADNAWTWEGYGRTLKGSLKARRCLAIDLADGPSWVDAAARAKKIVSSDGRPRHLAGRPREEYPGVTLDFADDDWSAYDRLVVDVVSHGLGGDKLMLYVKDRWTRNSQADWIIDAVTPGAWGVTRWVVDLARIRETTFVPSSVRQVHLFAHFPKCPDYEFAAFRLVRFGADLPPPYPVPADVAAKRAALDAADLAAKQSAMARLTPFGDLRLGVATAMEKIRPDRPIDARVRALGQGVQVKLAKNEHEALQILVGNAGATTAKDVRVSVSELTLERVWYRRLAGRAPVLRSTNVTVGVMGYVETKTVPRYAVGYNVATNNAAGYARLTRPVDPGWWPDPILDFMLSADVKPGAVQSFFVDVKCPKDQPAGLYGGAITVTCGAQRQVVPFKVKVWNFALSDAAPMPMAITFHVDSASPCRKLVDARLDEWTDFLADHFITIDSLYLYEHPRWDQLLRLKKQGRLGRFNLAMWQNFKRSADAEAQFKSPQNDWNGWGEVRMDREYAKAKELGLLDHAYIYGMDEIPAREFPSMKASLPYYKKRYPGVPIMTTCFDYTYGEDGMLSDIDVFIPDTTKYDAAQADKARAHGRHVWWYLACIPHAPYANFFIEYEAIEARSLMGVQAVKYRPEGFLFYQISGWRKNKPVMTGPFTDWNPISWGDSGNEYHGDGSWTIPGPDGRPLETLRLYNIRDGLEDYAYAKRYREKFGAWPAVPASVVESVTNFNVSASVHYRWRDVVAEKIAE